MQEYGNVLWNLVDASPIAAAHVADVRDAVEAKLDSGFFRVRAERTTALELRYMRAMAELGPDPQRAKDVAALLGRASEQLGPVRSRLIDKGLLYTPGHGLAAFTVSQFDRFMRRSYALEAVEAAEGHLARPGSHGGLPISPEAAERARGLTARPEARPGQSIYFFPIPPGRDQSPCSGTAARRSPNGIDLAGTQNDNHARVAKRLLHFRPQMTRQHP